MRTNVNKNMCTNCFNNAQITCVRIVQLDICTNGGQVCYDFMRGDNMVAKPRYNETSKAYSLEYHKTKLKRVPLDVPKDEFDAFKAACDGHNEKVNTVLRRLMSDYVSANKAGDGDKLPADHDAPGV